MVCNLRKCTKLLHKLNGVYKNKIYKGLWGRDDDIEADNDNNDNDGDDECVDDDDGDHYDGDGTYKGVNEF